MKISSRWFVAALLGGSCLMAQAAIVNYTGWAFGSGHSVHVGKPNHRGPAGGFEGSVDFSAAEEAAGFVDRINSSFISYCVEINQSFDLPSGNMAGYAVVDADDYVRSVDNTVLGADRAERLGRLMSWVAGDSQRVDSSAESASLQLAIWNLIYDTDESVTAGVFKEKTANGAYNAYANTLLADSLNFANRYEVFILEKNGSQDFILLRDQPARITTEVPEPGSLALTFAALGALGLGRRRRDSRLHQR
jgi:PEP-CTERM motif